MPLIDCDVHPLLPDGGESLAEYLPSDIRERLATRTLALGDPLPPSRFPHPGGAILRAESTPPSGSLPGSDPEFVREDLLERTDPAAAILFPLQGAQTGSWANPIEAVALASAFNNYFIERWLTVDDRFKLAMVIAPQDPVSAAAEVRRVGATEGVVGVWVPVLNILAGNLYYHPIYEAADELGLPVVFHPWGAEAMFQGTPSFAGGTPTTYAERFVDLTQIAQSNLVSLIFEGIPEKFPNLNFAFSEYGWTWLASLLWRMDATWKATRIETPWVKQSPTDYVRRRFRFSSQPMDEPEQQKRHIAEIAEMLHAGETLMFSSDYPHWDSDDVTRVAKVLPEEIRDDVMFGNAADLYGIPVPAATAA
ncbi:MAG TPA: amidohydrolase family protein [Solirubrobacterales bacterium]|nr:amidohydrolase family protein [Solirubrobacterales bacterium]